jgi:hypothetical protein
VVSPSLSDCRSQRNKILNYDGIVNGIFHQLQTRILKQVLKSDYNGSKPI